MKLVLTESVSYNKDKDEIKAVIVNVTPEIAEEVQESAPDFDGFEQDKITFGYLYEDDVPKRINAYIIGIAIHDLSHPVPHASLLRELQKRLNLSDNDIKNIVSVSSYKYGKHIDLTDISTVRIKYNIGVADLVQTFILEYYTSNVNTSPEELCREVLINVLGSSIVNLLDINQASAGKNYNTATVTCDYRLLKPISVTDFEHYEDTLIKNGYTKKKHQYSNDVYFVSKDGDTRIYFYSNTYNNVLHDFYQIQVSTRF